MTGSRTGTGRTKGPISQRDLLQILKVTIDDASAKNSSAHKDHAKHKLKELLDTTNWKTVYILNNISTRRARFIAGMGRPVPSKWLFAGEWKKRPGVDKPDESYE